MSKQKTYAFLITSIPKLLKILTTHFSISNPYIKFYKSRFYSAFYQEYYVSLFLPLKSEIFRENLRIKTKKGRKRERISVVINRMRKMIRKI